MFNVGDIVKLKTDLIVGKQYGNLTYWSNMSDYANKPLKIISTTHEANYRVENCCYVFSEEMLEFYDKKLTTPSMTHNFKVGDTVTIRKDLIPNSLYQHVAFVDGMSKYKGNTFKIKNIVKALPNTYILETLDGSSFWFTEIMFEKPLNIEGIFDSSIACIKSSSLVDKTNININIDKDYKWEVTTEYKSISEQIDKIKKDINSNKITITEVIINPCKKEIYTL